jgi:transposase
MFLKTKIIQGQPYLYAVHNAWNGGRPRAAFQTYLGVPSQLSGPQAAPIVRTFHYGAAAVLAELARKLQVAEIVNSVVENAGSPSVGEYILLAALNRAIEPHSKRAFAHWYERTSLKRLLPFASVKLSSQRFWDAMDQVSPGACQEIFHRVAKRAVEQFSIADEAVCFDTTNFFTFIASDNGRTELARRGRNKAKRYDLRQIGLGLAVTQQLQLPLFYYVYAGNEPDSSVFDALLPKLVAELSDLGQADATWVYDKGCVSERNQRHVQEHGIAFVTSVPPSYYPDLLAIDLERMTPVDPEQHPELEGFRIWAERRKRWGRELLLVMSHSPELAAGQLAGVLQHQTKAVNDLQALQTVLARRTPRSRGRKPTLASVRRQVERLLSPQHLRHLIEVRVYEEDGLVRLSYQIDDAHLQHLKDHLFGRRIWITSQLDWPALKVLQTAHQQASVEAAFRQIHDPAHVSWQPMHHWTDQKIRVHALYCLIAFLLVQLLRLLARRAGDARSVTAILTDLNEVQECLVVPVLRSPDERPHLETGLNVTDPAQRRLLNAVGIQGLPAATSA